MNIRHPNALIGILCSLGFALSTATISAQTTTTNLLINPGAETGDLTGWTSAGGSNPFAGDASALGDNISGHSGNYSFCGGTGAPTGALSQLIDLNLVGGVNLSMIDGGSLYAEVLFWEQGFDQGVPSDEAGVTLTFLDGSDTEISSVSSPLIDSHDGTWENYSAAYAIPSGTRSIEYTMNFQRNVGGDLDAFLDDNSLTITELEATPEPTTLSLLILGTGLVGWAWRKKQRAIKSAPGH